MGVRKICSNIIVAFFVLAGMMLMPGITAKALTRTFDGQSTMVIDQDCTVNIETGFSQKATLIIKSGNVTINGNGKMLYAADKGSWASLPSGYDSNFYRNSILIDNAATVTINNLSINYSTAGCGTDNDLVHQVICVRGNLTANNLKIQDAPDRGIYVANSGKCVMKGDSQVKSSNTAMFGDHAGVDVYGEFTMREGKISNSKYYGIKVRNGGVAYLKGGTISEIMKNSSTEKSSGVYVYSGGKLYLDGTVITNCDFGINTEGSVEFNSGEIKNLTTGGMCAVKVRNGEFRMNNGSIHDANAELGSVGGIIVNAGTFNMSGGEIYNCTGGVYIANGTMKMTGGRIYSCRQKGINNSSGNLQIGGSAKVDDNPSSTANPEVNVYLGSGKKMAVAETLRSDARIGVTTAVTPKSYNPVVITSGLNGKGNTGNFFAGNSQYAIGFKDNEAVLALKEEVHTVTFNSNGGTAVSTQQIYTGEKVAVPANPTKANYNFAGWYDRYGVRFNFGIGLAEDITLYAKWETHNHTFTYTASGNTITATCTNRSNCPLADKDYKVTISIEAPEIATPGAAGSANAKLIGLNEFNENTGLSVWDGNVTYVGRNGTVYPEVFAPPIATGDYSAKLTVKGVTAVIDYSLNNGTPGNKPSDDGKKPSDSETQKNNDGSETITETRKGPNGLLLISVIAVDKNGDTVETMTFECLSANEVALISYSGKKKKVVIPNTIKAKGITYRVVEIGDGVFKGNKKITSVTISKNVTSIGSNVFKSAKNLKTILIKGTVTEIGKNTFKSINKKATITIQNNKRNFKKIKKLVQKAGLAKSVKIKRK